MNEWMRFKLLSTQIISDRSGGKWSEGWSDHLSRVSAPSEMIAASHSTYSKPTNQPTCIPPITNVIVDRLAAVRNPKFFSPITAFQRVVPVPGTNSTRIVIQSLNYVKSTGGVAKCLSITQVSIQLICIADGRSSCVDEMHSSRAASKWRTSLTINVCFLDIKKNSVRWPTSDKFHWTSSWW